MQLKHYEIVTDADKLNVDIQKVCMEHTTIKHWAYILHDKDDTRPHYHIYVNFGKCGVRSDLVANWFGVAENFVSKIKGKKSDVLLYLIHGQDDQKNKHQYAPSEVVANFDWQTEVANSKILGDFETYSYAQMIAYMLCCAILFVTPSAAYAAETNDAINYDTYTDSKTFTWNGTQQSISDFINNDTIMVLVDIMDLW